ncbi:MAG: 2-dehydropantoate 2-reductase [Armatimonadetes bacterium]|nr:2-dehydropantoate 2-reductase [Armatimonadota bacterium]
MSECSSQPGHIVIVGPGAMGCGLSATLKQAGAHVSLLDHRPERADRLAATGIRVSHGDHWKTVRVPVTASPVDLAPVDLLIVLVKAYSTDSAAAFAAPCVGPETLVLTLQNGLGNWEVLARYFPAGQVLAGTIVMGCALRDVGEVVISGTGAITLGSAAGLHTAAERAAAILQPYWPDLLVDEHIEAALWRKAIINAAVNPLTALTGLPNGALLQDELLRETLGALADEGNRVAEFCGLSPFAGVRPEQAAEQVCHVTSMNRSSMLQDVAARRKTEIDQICGAILRAAERKGVRVPVLKTVTGLVKGLERGYSQPDRREDSPET